MQKEAKQHLIYSVIFVVALISLVFYQNYEDNKIIDLLNQEVSSLQSQMSNIKTQSPIEC